MDSSLLQQAAIPQFCQLLSGPQPGADTLTSHTSQGALSGVMLSCGGLVVIVWCCEMWCRIVCYSVLSDSEV